MKLMNYDDEMLWQMEEDEIQVFLKILERKRQKITQRGPLSPSQCYQLDLIDEEMAYLQYIIDSLKEEDPAA